MARSEVVPTSEVTPASQAPPELTRLVASVGAAAARAAGGGGGASGTVEAPADGVQLTGEADEGQDPEEARKAREAERKKAEEQDEARRAQEEKERQVQELMKEVLKALEEGDSEKARDLLRKIQEILGQEGAAPEAGAPPSSSSAGAPDGGGAAPVSAPSGIPGGGGVPGGGGAPSSYAPGGSSGAGSSAPAGQIDGEVKPPNGKIVPPLDNFRVTSEFGPRWGRQHTGIDLAAPQGTPIKAVMDGTVTRVASDPSGYGNWVEIRHADGSTSRYAHMSAFGKIKVGQEIGAGTVIGAVGSTGNSTGPHLHFEWRKNGVAVNPRGVFDWV